MAALEPPSPGGVKASHEQGGESVLAGASANAAAILTVTGLSTLLAFFGLVRIIHAAHSSFAEGS